MSLLLEIHLVDPALWVNFTDPATLTLFSTTTTSSYLNPHLKALSSVGIVTAGCGYESRIWQSMLGPWAQHGRFNGPLLRPLF